MTTPTWTAQTIQRLSRQTKEPSWITMLRTAAVQAHEALPWPNPSDEVWRRTDLSLLDPSKGFVVPDSPALLQKVRLSESELREWASPLGDEQLVVRADESWLREAAESGIRVQEISQVSGPLADRVKQIIESDGLSIGEQKLSSLNTAFQSGGLVVSIPDGYTGAVPLRLVRLLSAQPHAALFPLTIIVAGRGTGDEVVG